MKKTIKRICIWDFDGTLIRTPLPETGRAIWEQKNGLPFPAKGWWGRKETLCMDTFDMPVIKDVVAEYHKEKSKEDTLIVLMTGRHGGIGHLVKKICVAKSLEFDRFYFHRGGKKTTIEYKSDVLDELLVEFPEATEVVLHDDRPDHVEVFREWGTQQRGVSVIVNLVDGYKEALIVFPI